MTDHPIRFFRDDAAVRHIGAGLLARTLPRPEWTHEAHLAAVTWLLRERPEIDLDREIAAIISGYNAAVGGVNDDHHGYHDTITRTYLAGSRVHLYGRDPHEPLIATINALLAGPVGRRDWPLRFYSEARLMSVEARRSFLPPDKAPLPGPTRSC